MNYKELIYKNALKTCEYIYKESQYNPDVDLYRSFDVINATNPTQIDSKQWLVDNLAPIITDSKYLRDGQLYSVLILGAWYGVTSMLLRQHIEKDVKVWNVDSDPHCEIIGWELRHGTEEFKNDKFITEDALDYFCDHADNFQVVINTSCEHMEQDDLDMIIGMKPANTIVCFQTNNMHNEAEHINTHDSIESFEESLNLVRVFWSGTHKMKDSEYERYMVIGI